MHLKNCRYKIGKRCKKIPKSNVFKKYILVTSIDYNSVIDWTLYKYGGINNEKLVNLLNRKILKKK